MRKGLLTVISGFSGAGKGTILKGLMKKYDNYSLSISATTRAPREGEIEGREYFFLSKEEFEKRIIKNEFIEYASYVNNYYGTPKDYVFEKLNEGIDVILEIDIQGALRVKQKFKNTLLIFVAPPSALCLKERLIGRGTETREQIEERLKKAVEESDRMNSYDYIVINDDLDAAIIDTHNLIQSQKYSTSLNEQFISDIQEDMRKEYLKEVK